MSREGVEVVRRVYSEGQWLLTSTPEQLDRVFQDYLDEGFEFRLPSDYPEGQLVFRGREGADQLNAMLRETWSEWRFEPDRFIDAGDQVVVFARLLGRGGSSRVPFELETTHVWTLRAGRAISIQACTGASARKPSSGPPGSRSSDVAKERRDRGSLRTSPLRASRICCADCRGRWRSAIRMLSGRPARTG